MKKTITILLTDVSHPVTSRAVEILKENQEFSITVIGVDSTNSDTGSLWVDKLFNISKPESLNYAKELLNICTKEKVNVILPWTNSETLAISKSASLFQSRNIKIVSNDYILTNTLVDKGLLYQALKGLNIPIPKYQLVSNINDLEKAIDQLGYPENKVVVKPRNLSGGRGLFVLSATSNLELRDANRNIPKTALLEIVLASKHQNNLDYIVMEYLEGEDYSVDTLSSKGKPLFIVQRTRISDSGGISSIGETVNDKKVRTVVENIIKYFKIDSNCNLQLKYKKGQVGFPYIYDINPRISGTIVANTYAGIDLLTLGIYQALNIPFPKNHKKKYRHLKMVRYWSEKYQILSDKRYPA
ncbi:ATP-grasp domain-containing protein [Patescibacteria group bacterium]|nr:ATP-grasp domain-containing protein [Patescibacteria group bacterium]